MNLASKILFIRWLYCGIKWLFHISSRQLFTVYTWSGFDCRCGGHFCSVHRYSDMHQCAFNYHALAQSEIRKHNPIVAAEKVKKIWDRLFLSVVCHVI